MSGPGGEYERDDPGAYIGAAYVGEVRRRRGEAARAELGQMLARYEGPVQGWPLELDLRTTGEGDDRGAGLHQAHLVCGECRQSVFVLAKDLARGVAVVTLAELGAAVTRHYRESHTDGGGIPI